MINNILIVCFSDKLPEIEFCVLSHWFDWILKTQNIKVDLIGKELISSFLL